MGLAASCRRGGRSFLARTERPSGSASPPFGGRATAARDTDDVCDGVVIPTDDSPRKSDRAVSRIAPILLFSPFRVGFLPTYSLRASDTSEALAPCGRGLRSKEAEVVGMDISGRHEEDGEYLMVAAAVHAAVDSIRIRSVEGIGFASVPDGPTVEATVVLRRRRSAPSRRRPRARSSPRAASSTGSPRRSSDRVSDRSLNTSRA